MTQLRIIISLIILVLIYTVSVLGATEKKNENLNNIKGFADSLFNEKDYERAFTEYNEFYIS
jgi:hypothetical protein